LHADQIRKLRRSGLSKSAIARRLHIGRTSVRHILEREDSLMNAMETVLRFIEFINAHNLDKLAAMMTEDHVFIDSLGQAVRGREKMRTGWRSYFAFCPDYWVSHEEIFQHGNLVAVFGAAGGTIAANGNLPPEDKWRIPAAWLALVEKDLVKEWRVYADNKPVYDITAKSKSRATP
jgi:ketosteroid isomerase-like protein